MCVQWCVRVPGEAFDPDPADGDAAADGAADAAADADRDAADADDDVDALDVDVAPDEAPCVPAKATPVAPAPIPAARNAVKMKRRIRPLVVDAIWLPPSLSVPGGPTVGPRWLKDAQPDPARTRSAALRLV
jgi:hypothetical protein